MQENNDFLETNMYFNKDIDDPCVLRVIAGEDFCDWPCQIHIYILKAHHVTAHTLTNLYFDSLFSSIVNYSL